MSKGRNQFLRKSYGTKLKSRVDKRSWSPSELNVGADPSAFVFVLHLSDGHSAFALWAAEIDEHLFVCNAPQ
eukprot:SAG31_NODE_4913_length_2871_cov_2.230159_2_plen_72_part_00